jgi:hypothetical protein
MWSIFHNIDDILHNISHIQSECENIMHNIVNPA